MRTSLVLTLASLLLTGCGSPSPTTPQAVALGQGGQAWLYAPTVAQKGPTASVLVVPGEAGITPGVKQMAQTLQKQGYRVLVVDLYRGEKVGEGDTLDAHIMSRAIDEQQVADDLKHGLGHLAQQPSPVALLGFDLGGAYALEAALRHPEVRLVVSLGGRPITDAEKLAPLQAAVLAFYGGKDEGISPDSREAFRATLARAGKRLIDLQVLEASGDDLLNPPRGEADARAITRILDTLRSELR
jgi:carboxymethylenebutenolidase